MSRVYIAGPMSNYPGHNFKAFNTAASLLTLGGHTVVNPVDINPDPTSRWADCLKQDLPRLLECDMVVVLPNWELSKGAKLEVHVAQAVGIPTLPLHLLTGGLV